jgi:hypothetical protein
MTGYRTAVANSNSLSNYQASNPEASKDSVLAVFLDAMTAHGRKYTGPDSGGWYSGQCPNGQNHRHGDAGMSFRFRAGDRGIVTECHGCPAVHDDSCAALGLTVADTFYGNSRRDDDTWAPWQAKGTCDCPILERYPYTDEDDRLLYQVVRGHHKEFSQRQPDPASRSGWRWNIRGVRTVLYRLPRLLAAPPSACIFVAEGERDVHALEAAGETATTCPGGARNLGKDGKQWLPEWSECLRGRDVLVLADRDTPGRTHAQHVAGQLDGTARFVWIVEAAAGKDARDHLNAGLAVTDLVWWA